MSNPKLTDTMTWPEIIEKIMLESNNGKDAFKKWLLSKEKDGGLFFNSNLYARAYNIQHSINTDDRDHFIVVCGKEGLGKSTLAIQLACMIDPTFNIKRICFKPIDFIQGIRQAKKGDCFILDEGNLFVFSRESLGADNVMIVKLFALMRQKNLCVIINVPNFFTLDSYVRDHRTDTLIYCRDKGKFTCYVKKAIQIISKEGHAYKQINGVIVPHGTFFPGYWNKFLPKINDISEESYKQHKGNQFAEFLDDLESNVAQTNKGNGELITTTEALKIIPGKTLHHLIDLIKKGEVKGKRIGQRWYVYKSALMDTESKTQAGGTLT